jgi:hypothetical protein
LIYRDMSLTQTATMSKIPTVFEPKGVFAFLIAQIKEYNPAARKTDIGLHIRLFLANPTIKELLNNSQAPAATAEHILQMPGDEIQATLKLLSLVISSIQKKLSTTYKQQAAPSIPKCGKGPITTTTKKYSAIARSRPPNLSLVVDLAHLNMMDMNWPKLEHICQIFNKRFGEVTPPQVSLATIRWTVRANLVVTGRPTSTPATLQIAAVHISATLKDILKTPSNAHLLVARPNIKWSKISINGVPTGMSNKCMAYTPTECHNTLTTINPSYAQLTVMQRPSWVCTPTSYTEGAIFSLLVAFEDPDGSRLKTMLAEHYLYINGTRATVKKWKHHPPNCKDNSKTPATQHTMDGNSTSEDNKEEVMIQLQTPP